jgi:NAD(P)-dependent dehydrogenase (short-subunit alcohol dehydrogenase family)
MSDPSEATSGRGILAGKRVVVSGGARGIGAEIAARLASEGARVTVLDRLVPEGTATASRIGGAFREIDLTDAASTASVLSGAIDDLGGIDVLVNSAGILRFSPLLDLELDDWDDTFAINTRAMLVTMQVTARRMIGAATGGKIINLASMAAKKGGAGEGAYPPSKSAVVALTRVAALEWGQYGITVNSLCPGFILTEMGAATRTPEKIAEWSSWSPLGRLGHAQDVAGVALFLASADADYLTGQAINVTGGMIMH